MLFLDEIDAFLPARGGGGASTHDRSIDRVIGQFLAELDGVEALKGVLILGATNRPDLLDPALLRPGRFDLHLVIPLPNHEARKEIAEIALRKKDLAEDLSFDDIARVTDGFSGADVHALCMTASLNAFRQLLENAKTRATPRIVIDKKRIMEALADHQARNREEGSKP